MSYFVYVCIEIKKKKCTLENSLNYFFCMNISLVSIGIVKISYNVLKLNNI